MENQFFILKKNYFAIFFNKMFSEKYYFFKLEYHFSFQNYIIMAKSKKQQRVEARQKKEEKKIIQIVVVTTLILVGVLYFSFIS